MDQLFPGLSAMQNIHPVFVHCPLVLLPLALVFQAWAVVSGREDIERVGRWVLWLGAVAALAAAASGLQAEETVEHAEAAHEVMELHESLMLTATGLAVLLALLSAVFHRRTQPLIRWVLLVGLLATTGVLAVGADRGGQLVYQFGVGVQRPEPAPAAPQEGPTGEKPAEHKHDHDHKH